MIALCALLTSAHTRQPQARLSDGTVDWHHQRDGMECFETCGKKAGTCMNFCGVEKAWWGGCCMANATGNLSAPECENRGCVGHHCCVSTDIKRGTTDQQPQAEQARAHAQQAAAQALTPSQPASTEEEGAMCPGHPNIHLTSSACPTADAKEDAPEEKAKAKDKGAKADEICQKPETWCIHAGATNELKECGGLIGHFCFDTKGNSGFFPCDEDVKPTWGKVECKGAKSVKNPKDTYHKPEWSAKDLAEIFQHGKPSNDLSKAGLLVHGFDGTELDHAHRWQPCTVGFCAGAAKWWSTSLINQVHQKSWGANGLILSPSRTKVLCSHYSDFGSLAAGCNSSAPDGFDGGHPYPPDQLKDMLQRSMYEGGPKMGYNEVLIDMPEYVANLPQSVAAFYFKDGPKGFAQVEARYAYVSFLDAFNMTEESVPLLKFPANMSGGQPMENVAGSARAYLKTNKYSAWREKWRKEHPYLVEHPEELPSYLRGKAAHSDEDLPERQRAQLRSVPDEAHDQCECPCNVWMDDEAACKLRAGHADPAHQAIFCKACADANIDGSKTAPGNQFGCDDCCDDHPVTQPCGHGQRPPPGCTDFNCAPDEWAPSAPPAAAAY